MLIIITIMTNSILLSMADYGPVAASNELSEDGSSINYVIIHSETVLMLIFAIELVLKVLALGFERFY